MIRLILLITAITLTSCGFKGSLKTPSQIEAEEAKEAAKAKKEAEAPTEQ